MISRFFWLAIRPLGKWSKKSHTERLIRHRINLSTTRWRTTKFLQYFGNRFYRRSQIRVQHFKYIWPTNVRESLIILFLKNNCENRFNGIRMTFVFMSNLNLELIFRDDPMDESGDNLRQTLSDKTSQSYR